MYKIIGADGQEYGPVDLDQIRDWVRANRVNGQTLVQPNGSTDWKPLASLPEFAGLFAGGPPSLPGSGQQPMPPLRPLIRPVPTYLAPAILCTLLCCLPLGVPAIYYASKVTAKESAGDIAGAESYSRKARAWCWAAFLIGVISNIVLSLMV